MSTDLRGKQLPSGIYQRKDGRYEARVVVHGIKIQLYSFNLKELKAEFKKQKELAEQGIDDKMANITLDEWFEEWFEKYKIPFIKETSVSPMRAKYRSSFGRLIGHMKVSDIRNIDIQNVINVMRKEGRATSSMRDALGRVRECLEAAKYNRIISENPCFAISVPWENVKRERRFLTKEEQNRFLRQAEGNWYKEMFYIMFLTGMRIGEVGGLKWEDVDFKNKCINIQRSLSCQYEEGIKTVRLTKPKTFNSYRKIPFMGEAEEMFLSQRKKQEMLKKELGQRYRSKDEYEDLVFVTSLGSLVFRHHAEKEIKKIVKEINDQEAFDSARELREPHYFEHMYPHAIRHTFCSRCFQLNMNPKVVQKIMGHQHYSTTIDTYTHIMQDEFENEISKMESAVSK